MFGLIGSVLGLVLSSKFWIGVAAGAVVGGPALLKAWQGVRVGEGAARPVGPGVY